jgi:hypothetical protein
MDVVKEEPVFQDGIHEITLPDELVIDMKYEDYKVSVIETDDKVSLILGNLKRGSSL